MFRCDGCGRVTAMGEKQRLIVTGTRRLRHPFRRDANRFKRAELTSARWRRIPGKEGSRWVVTDDPGGEGSQIVGESRICASCVAAQGSSERRATSRRDEVALPKWA